MAWNPATLTGTVKDASNNPVTASGTIWFTVSQNGNSTSGGFQVARNSASVFAMTNGVIAASSQITANDDISPAGTFYVEEVISADGGLIVRRNVTINGPGTSVDIGTLATPALPASSLPTTGTVTATTGVTTGTQTASRFIGPATGLRSATTDIDVAAAAAPTVGQVLTAISGAAANWQAPASGVPTARLVQTTAPLTGGGDLTADRTFAMPAATDSVDGYLASADHAKPLYKDGSRALTANWTAGAFRIDSLNSLRWYNVVTGYGADNTGVSDASTAIQNAVNAASTAGGGIVYCPVGTYKIGTVLSMPNYVSIVGDGQSTILRASGNNFIFNLNPANRTRFSNFRIEAISTQTAGGGFDYTNAGSHVYLDNIYIFDNLFTVFSVTPAASATMFLFDNVRYLGTATDTVFKLAPAVLITLSLVKVRDFAGTSTTGTGVTNWITIATGASANIDSLYLTNVVLYQGVNGLKTTGTNKITGCKLYNYVPDTLSGSALQIDNIKDWHVLGSSINTCGSNTIPAVQIGANAVAVNLSGNTIQNCPFTAIDVAAGAKIIRIIGNTISDNNTGNNANGDGIRIGAANTDFQIVGNSVTNGVVLTTGFMKTGINVLAGASDFYDILGNAYAGLVTANLTDGGTGVSKHVETKIRAATMGSIVFTQGANTVGSGQVSFGNGVATTATAGAQTLPANPDGFLTINVAGTAKKVPYYQN